MVKEKQLEELDLLKEKKVTKLKEEYKLWKNN